jgi:glycosyltransferase involved in cell wall biosynthesis
MNMKIAIVVETFARDMGYINNTLPKYLARNGAEVHVITTELPPYHQIGSAKAVFGQSFADQNRNEPGTRQVIDGYTLHTLPHKKSFGYPRPTGLFATLRDIRPDVVCIFQAAGWIPLECALYRRRLGYRFVIGSHMGKTVFNMAGSPLSPRRLRSFALRTMPGWYVASQAEHCVVPTLDCAQVVSAYFGVPKRMVRVMNLPVDTEFFYPESGRLRPQHAKFSNRSALRTSLGIDEDEVLCVYSGKFTADKNPLVLARAVAELQQRGQRVRALFIGSGEQEALIKASLGAVVVPFMPIRELGDYYRASDIGVWMNESISFLDGACCGLPLLLSDVVKDASHLQEFSAIYRANDSTSLAAQITDLLDPVKRLHQSELAARLGDERFSGQRYARLRLEQFKEALAPHQIAEMSGTR